MSNNICNLILWGHLGPLLISAPPFTLKSLQSRTMPNLALIKPSFTVGLNIR